MSVRVLLRVWCAVGRDGKAEALARTIAFRDLTHAAPRDRQPGPVSAGPPYNDLVVDSAEPALSLDWRPRAVLRVTWTLVTAFAVESAILAVSILPAILFWRLFALRPYPELLRLTILSLMLVPAYVLFAIALMVTSAAAMRLVGWRTPRDVELSIAALEWPLLDWVRYMISVHIVRLFAGSLFRATPVWTFYLRLNGARLGKGVYVNSLAVNDHNLLEFDDYVVIGDGVHLSGHTVERGRLLTAGVRLGRGVVIGLGSVVGIGVEAGPRCQVGALSLVPKFTTLEADAVYVGTPVHKLEE